MAFRVGQKVVCITDGWVSHFGEASPQKDRVYTIRAIVDRSYGTGLRLVEIKNRRHLYDGNWLPCECSFAAQYFRPLVDISNLRSIVREVFQTKRRTVNVPADRFDKHKVH